MNASREEAARSLDDVHMIAERTRKAIAYAGADIVFVIWGIIWFIGYLSAQFFPLQAHWVWMVLVIGGMIASALTFRSRSPVVSPLGARLGAFWLLLSLFVGLWGWLLSPFLSVPAQADVNNFWMHMHAITATIVMFAYVVMGLWLRSFMLWLGLGISALTVIGLLFLQPLFWIWMAVIGGGSLVVTGLIVRRKWQ